MYKQQGQEEKLCSKLGMIDSFQVDIDAEGHPMCRQMTASIMNHARALAFHSASTPVRSWTMNDERSVTKPQYDGRSGRRSSFEIPSGSIVSLTKGNGRDETSIGLPPRSQDKTLSSVILQYGSGLLADTLAAKLTTAMDLQNKAC